MKGTEKIIAHIQADAKQQADAILAQAEQQCAGIMAQYEEKAKESYAAKIRAGVNECQARMDGVERIARMEGKKSLLALKQGMVAESFDKARAMLLELPEDKYVALLSGLAAKASVSGDEEIVLNERDKAACGQAVVDGANALIPGGKLSLSEKTGSFEGGLILSRGSIETNCTVELLTELCRAEMSAAVAKVLFN